jgi:hypothetical protein
MTGADGYELSDRWQESQMLMHLVRDLWRRLEQEDNSTAGAGMTAGSTHDRKSA